MEIKPCPFCGSNHVGIKIVYGGRTGFNVFAVNCVKCGASGAEGKTKEEAIALWNAAPRKENDKMEQNCGNCKYNQDGYCSAVPPYKYFQVDSHLCCTDWEAKESESTPLTPSNSSGLDTADEIAAKTDFRANVTQLMEEAAELVAACSKYLRTCGIGQPTPVTVDEALAMIGEEAADVHLVTEVIMQQSEAVDDVFTETANRKILRWKGRLENDRQR